MTLERHFQAQVIELARIYRWRVAHFRPAQTAKGWRTPVEADGKGFPDLVLVRDRVIFAELKGPHGRLTTDQRQWNADLVAAGAEFYVWRPEDLEAVESILRPLREGMRGVA